MKYHGVLVGIGWNREYSQQQMARESAHVVETTNQIWSWAGMPFGALEKTNEANSIGSHAPPFYWVQ